MQWYVIMIYEICMIYYVMSTPRSCVWPLYGRDFSGIATIYITTLCSNSDLLRLWHKNASAKNLLIYIPNFLVSINDKIANYLTKQNITRLKPPSAFSFGGVDETAVLLLQELPVYSIKKYCSFIPLFQKTILKNTNPVCEE